MSETDTDSGVAGALRILTSGLTDEEVAAVTAVVALAVEELAAAQVPGPDPVPPRWRQGAGAMRHDLGPLHGSWAHSLR